MSDIYLSITETPAVVTLSQAVISGALASTVTVANTVTVALDANSLNALEQVTVTVGAAVSVSNFPSTQTISGTVTANLSADSFVNAVITNNANGDPLAVLICNGNGGIESNNPLFIAGTVTANVGIVNDSNFNYNSDKIMVAGGVEQLSPEGRAGGIAIDSNNAVIVSSVTIGSLPAISGTVTPSLGIGGPYDFWSDENVSIPNSAVAIGAIKSGLFEKVSDSNPLPISGTVTANITNSITVGSLPVQLSTTTIGGTARLNVTLSSATTVGATAPSYANLYGGSDGTNLRAISVDSSGRTVVTVSNFPSTQPVSIASLPSLAAGSAQIGSVTASISGTVPVSGTFWQATQPVSGTVTAAVVSTTVTVSALPSGVLTTRFGSVTTANTAQLTTAVTNTSRKYLLAQNLDPSTTVTIGIGFTPTTTQGIQLAAGGGIIMDSFVSTGAVWWLSSTTGSNFTILEG